jgi:hypothetical protein
MLFRATWLMIFSLALFSGQALSKDETIRFYFKHQENYHSQARLRFHVWKGGHLIITPLLSAGQTDTGKTTNSIFAPTPSGTYHVTFECLRDYGFLRVFTSEVTQTFQVASHSKPIHIQALCHDQIIGDDLAPATNISIEVEK